MITVTGARTDNLRDIDVNFPSQALTEVTGLSGSGKSSLVFDTIAAEAQRATGPYPSGPVPAGGRRPDRRTHFHDRGRPTTVHWQCPFDGRHDR